MADNENEAKPQRTPDELRQALQNCEVRRREVKSIRKSITKDYNEQLKDIDDEITGILDQLKQLAGPA